MIFGKENTKLVSYVLLVSYSLITSSSILYFCPTSTITLHAIAAISAFRRKSSPRDQNKYIMSGLLVITAHRKNSWKPSEFSWMLSEQSAYNFSKNL